jgi:hypothetical protein
MLPLSVQLRQTGRMGVSFPLFHTARKKEHEGQKELRQHPQFLVQKWREGRKQRGKRCILLHCDSLRENSDPLPHSPDHHLLNCNNPSSFAEASGGNEQQSALTIPGINSTEAHEGMAVWDRLVGL